MSRRLLQRLSCSSRLLRSQTHCNTATPARSVSTAATTTTSSSSSASSSGFVRSLLYLSIAGVSISSCYAYLQSNSAVAQQAHGSDSNSNHQSAAAATAADADEDIRLQAAHAELAALLGDRFSTQSSDIISHSNDAFSHHKAESDHNKTLYGVAFAMSTEEVSSIVRICHRHRVRMIPYGSGTSLEGHTSAPQGGICISLANMNNITRLSVTDMDCTVQAGITWNNLNEELKSSGLFFPVDPGPGASIGGMVGTSCSGTNAVRYGTMKHNVLSLTAVLPDGTIVRTGQRARKSSAGYDLTRLFIGSEGTLGIVTEITVRLQPIPQTMAVASCSFESIGAAAEATAEIVQQGVRVGCVELLDDECMKNVNAYSGLSYPLKPATLFFKFHGATQAVNEEILLSSAISSKHGAGPFVFATDQHERDKIWEGRKGALWACIAARPGAEAWTTDVCVPISAMATCIEQTKKDIASLDVDEKGDIITLSDATKRRVTFPSSVVGHVGDGNFHVIMLLDPKVPHEGILAAEINRRMVHRALDADGTCTGEHGVGVGKKEFLPRELGETSLQMMRDIKHAVDPFHIMNPGKIFDMNRPPAGTCSVSKGCHIQPSSACSPDGECVVNVRKLARANSKPEGVKSCC